MGADQARVYELMSRYSMKPRLASYIAQAQWRILDQTDTSIHFIINYPDSAKIDESVNVAADPSYTPTPADLQRAARSPHQVHGASFTTKKTGPKEWQYTLQYHLPYSQIPSELLQRILPKSNSASGGSHVFDLVRPVYADGALPAGEAVVSVVANYFATYYDKMWEMEKHSVGVDIPLALLDLADDLLTLKGWVSEVGELEDCAKNPTNPLSQKASHDQNYQHDVLDPLSDAKGDVISTLAPTLASDTAGFITHWLPFGSGAVAGLIFSTQDEAVAQFAEGRIQEAGKYIVPCHEQEMVAGQFRPMQGTLTYAYKFNSNECKIGKCVEFEEERKFEGAVHLVPDSFGYLAGQGNGQFNGKSKQHAWDQYCKTAGWNQELEGPGKIEVEAGGDSPLNGYIKVRFGSNDLTRKSSQTSCSGERRSDPNQAGAFGGASCDFPNVDLVHGGTYSAFENGDPHGTCKLELAPQ